MRPLLATIVVILWLVTLVVPPADALLTPSATPQPIFYKGQVEPPTSTDPKEIVAVMLELSEPAALTAGDRTAVMRQGASNLRQQSRLLSQITMSGVKLLFHTQLAYNGVAVLVPYGQLNQLRRMPDVVGIHLISPKERSSINTLMALSTAQWTYGGATGQNVRVGIIDSGIDYTHATFGGPGTALAYEGNQRGTIEAGSFPTTKVVGGYDFAGDAYDASSGGTDATPIPDPDPLDCNGHGTHIASTVAGFGVTNAGQTYQGPYNSTLNAANFQVLPGVAPRALLYAYKVFGCDGTTALLTAAIERAIDPDGNLDPSDHLDVLAVAMSAPFGSNNDPDSVAANNAVRQGLVVVTAAGDNANTFHVLSSPSSASLAIAVGATNESSAASGSTAGMAPFSSRGPQRGQVALKPDLVAPGVAVQAADRGAGTSATTMSGTSIATATVAGAAALLRQLHPNWTPMQIKAALVNGATPVSDGTGSAPPSLAGGGRLNLGDLPERDLLIYQNTPDSPVGLTFGAPWLTRTTALTRSLVVENTGGMTRTVSLASTTVVSENGVTLTLPTQTLLIPPQSQMTVPVTMTVQPSLLDFTPDNTLIPPVGPNGTPVPIARFYMAEHGGYIEASSTNAQVRLAHAANHEAVDIYVDKEQLAQELNASEVTDYIMVPAGTHTVSVVPAGEPQSIPILTTEVKLPAEGNYSLMLIGQDEQLAVLPVDDNAALTATRQPGRDGTVSQRPINRRNHATTARIRYVNSNLDDRQGPGALDVYFDETLALSGLAPGDTSRIFEVPQGTHAVAFVKAGQPLDSTTLVAWQVFTAAAGEQLLVGAGQYDEGHPQSTEVGVAIIKAGIESGEIDASRCIGICPGVWAEFQQGTGWISSAWRRGVTASAMLLSAPEEITLRLPYNIFPKIASNASIFVPTVTPTRTPTPGTVTPTSTPTPGTAVPTSTPTPTIPTRYVKAISTTFDLEIRNTGARNLGAPFPIVGAFELTGSSNQLAISNAADLRSIGVTSYVPSGTNNTPFCNAAIYFGIATYQPWSTPNEVSFKLYIDTTSDSIADYLLTNSNTGQAPNDAFVSSTHALSSSSTVTTTFTYWNTFAPPSTPTSMDTAPFNTRVVLLSTNGAALGLAKSCPDFRYRLESYARDSDHLAYPVDTLPTSGGWLTYSITGPALRAVNNSGSSFPDRPLFRDAQGARVVVGVNTSILAARGGQRMLLLHLHNPPNNQVEEVNVMVGP